MCNLSLAKACQVARSKSRLLSSVFSVCVGSKSSKTGRAHCMPVIAYFIESVYEFGAPGEDLQSLVQLTCA